MPHKSTASLMRTEARRASFQRASGKFVVQYRFRGKQFKQSFTTLTDAVEFQGRAPPT